ncbi:uncharacterized protein [Lolium perenne]|uniref:uncharacterized protein n=1 Tax=Lolium perenne TaxID=4522 RepID=UPI003A9A1935
MDGALQHPLVDGLPCPVLQYADDTLIILRAEEGAVHRLRGILDSFSCATGLVINFHKSMVVPMHVDEAMVAVVRTVLGCSVEGFPQTYLGLPLLADKLKLAAFAPLIAKVDKYLSGWRALLLSYGGRLALVNAILDALPTYAMGALDLPPRVLEAFDRSPRLLLGGRGPRLRSAMPHRLVAGLPVKGEGGLGVRSLRDQNDCLQVKLLHRLHSADDTSWPAWVWSSLGGNSLATERGVSLCGPHWSALRRLLPLYRSINMVSVDNGRATSFCFDVWLPIGE